MSEAIILYCRYKICDHYSGLIVYLATYTALHSSYHIGEPIFIPKLLLPCVYDTMIMQQRIHLITLLYCSLRFSASVAASFLMATLASGRVYTPQEEKNKGVNKQCSTSLIRSPYSCFLSPSNILHSDCRALDR